MAQAKRKSTSRSSSSSSRLASPQSFRGLGMLLVGMMIGSLVTVLWQGTQTTETGIGAGIRQMIVQSKQQDEETPTDRVHAQDAPVKQQTSFDFYTVLPEIEVVVPTPNQNPTPAPDSVSANNAKDSVPATPPTIRSANSPAITSSYMLQAGSYKSKTDADRIKAQLAFQGLVASIQKVSIQDRGNFYRVRLGPYASYEEMVATDQKLVSRGIKTLRLKISKGG